MGFIAKQRTKARVAATSYATTLSAQWSTEGMPRMSAVVRTAAALLAGGSDLRSSGFRGTDTLGIFSAIRSGTSTVWVEQAGFDTWAIALGLETVRGAAFDWQLVFKVTSAGAPVTVAVTTPTVLTRDGSQVHRDEYLKAREAVVAGLVATSAPPPAYEESVSTVGLGFPTRALASAETFAGPFSVTTTLPGQEIHDRLLVLPFQRLDGSSGIGRWQLGVAAASPVAWVDGQSGPAEEQVCLTFTPHIGAGLNAAMRTVAVRHATRFQAAVEALLARPATASAEGNAS